MKYITKKQVSEDLGMNYRDAINKAKCNRKFALIEELGIIIAVLFAVLLRVFMLATLNRWISLVLFISAAFLMIEAFKGLLLRSLLIEIVKKGSTISPASEE